MLVQFYYPTSLPRKKLDQLLADGWFRSSMMLHRSKVICLNEDIYSILNIRLNLERFSQKKRHRKLARRVFNGFNVSIRPATFSDEKDELYQQHTHRFKGFIHSDLKQLMNAYLPETIFDTYEVTVHDGDRLIACSFFDKGAQSLASIIGFYDHSYHRYSLGIFTMLAEIDYGQANGYTYYYPGYVLDKPSEFDYKLTLGDFEFRNHEGEWINRSELQLESMPGAQIEAHVVLIRQELFTNGISHLYRLNPFYTLGYVEEYDRNALKGTAVVLIPQFEVPTQSLVIEYVHESGHYSLTLCDAEPSEAHLLDTQLTSELKNEEVYIQDIFFRKKHLLSTPSVVDMVLYVKANFPSTYNFN